MALKKGLDEKRVRYFIDLAAKWMLEHIDDTQDGMCIRFNLPDTENQGLLDLKKEKGWRIVAGAARKGSDKYYTNYMHMGDRETTVRYLNDPATPEDIYASIAGLSNRVDEAE